MAGPAGRFSETEVWAIVALNAGDRHKALELKKQAGPYDKGSIASLYVRGLPCLKAGQATDAVAEFQKILALYDLEPGSPLMSMARLGLARAYAAQGETSNARKNYQDFLALWKDSDLASTTLKQVQADYAKLQ